MELGHLPDHAHGGVGRRLPQGNPSSSSPGTATVTLSNPQDQTPAIWGTATEVVNAPAGATYTLPTSQVPAS